MHAKFLRPGIKAPAATGSLSFCIANLHKTCLRYYKKQAVKIRSYLSYTTCNPICVLEVSEDKCIRAERIVKYIVFIIRRYVFSFLTELLNPCRVRQ